MCALLIKHDYLVYDRYANRCIWQLHHHRDDNEMQLKIIASKCTLLYYTTMNKIVEGFVSNLLYWKIIRWNFLDATFCIFKVKAPISANLRLSLYLRIENFFVKLFFRERFWFINKIHNFSYLDIQKRQLKTFDSLFCKPPYSTYLCRCRLHSLSESHFPNFCVCCSDDSRRF